MSIGLFGVAISLTLGVILGSISGFYGGWADLTIQRIIEVISSMPTIPLWLGLAAAVVAVDAIAAHLQSPLCGVLGVALRKNSVNEKSPLTGV